MYFHMQKDDSNPLIDRGIALHKMIRLFTISLGGQAYLNFMGNEFGHPEWIDFPREGNGWNYKHALRQWSLVDNPLLKYHFLGDFDKAMIGIVQQFKLLQSSIYARMLNLDENNKCIIFERSGLIFLFNFQVDRSIPDYEFAVPMGGDFQIILNSDNPAFGGHGRINESNVFPTIYKPESRTNYLRVYLTSRTALVLNKINTTG